MASSVACVSASEMSPSPSLPSSLASSSLVSSSSPAASSPTASALLSFKQTVRRLLMDSKAAARAQTPPPSAGATSKAGVGASASASASALPHTAKYGRLHEDRVIGHGANSIVFLGHSDRPVEGLQGGNRFAIKAFNPPPPSSPTSRAYFKKLSSEYCIGSTLSHPNVIKALDLVQNDRNQWCEIIEYCPNGDLCTRLMSGEVTQPEADAVFGQLLAGVAYLHAMGVAHRDLKPENLMFDAEGVLKIVDFGEAEVFRSPFEVAAHTSHRFAGSGPYMAPEEFNQTEFDPRQVDIWACGIIFMAMYHHRLPWRLARQDDPHFTAYLSVLASGGTPPILALLPAGPRPVISRILDPNPAKRIRMDAILADPWVRSILPPYALSALASVPGYAVSPSASLSAPVSPSASDTTLAAETSR